MGLGHISGPDAESWGGVEAPAPAGRLPAVVRAGTLRPQLLCLLGLVVVDPGLLAFACCSQSSLGSSGEPGVDACSVLLVCRALCPRLRSSLGPRWVDSCVGPRPGSFGEDGPLLGSHWDLTGKGAGFCRRRFCRLLGMAPVPQSPPADSHGPLSDLGVLRPHGRPGVSLKA